LKLPIEKRSWKALNRHAVRRSVAAIESKMLLDLIVPQVMELLPKRGCVNLAPKKTAGCARREAGRDRDSGNLKAEGEQLQFFRAEPTSHTYSTMYDKRLATARTFLFIHNRITHVTVGWTETTKFSIRLTRA
jgi:hypothetical protein